MDWYKLIICLIAGAGAGIGTGFAGMSAAVVISPMLIAFLKIPAYQAIGIALASDVLASAVSAITYKKHGNIDIKNALIMMSIVLLFTIIASYVAKFVPNAALGGWSELTMVFLGLKFIIWPTKKREDGGLAKGDQKKKLIFTIASAIYIGCVCGFVGAGGGMMLLLALTVVLGYDLKMAVGTSVFIMTFTALTGAVSHFVVGGMPDIVSLILCVIFTCVFAQIASIIANRAKDEVLNRITGALLVVISIAVFVMDYVIK